MTARETDCLTWVARGKSAREIGKTPAISANTVNYPLKSSAAKLGVTGRTQMVGAALKRGLIEP